MEYLRDEQCYIDRYDLHTIEECLDTVNMFQGIYQKSQDSKKLKDIPKEKTTARRKSHASSRPLCHKR